MTNRRGGERERDDARTPPMGGADDYYDSMRGGVGGARLSTRGRSAGSREYVRGGRGRGRAAYPVRGSTSRGRGGSLRSEREPTGKTEHRFRYVPTLTGIVWKYFKSASSLTRWFLH